jgi:glycosyltransferase involved in cell wall biosynthesis
MENSLTISIIIPAYNEALNLEASFFEAQRAAISAGLSAQFIIVDDASTDNTYEIAQKLSKEKGVSVVRNKKNLNLGGAYKAGLKKATGKYVTWVPADCSHSSAQLKRVYEHLGEADFLIAIPDNKHVRPLKRRVISTLYTFVVNRISGNTIKYFNGLSVYRTADLQDTSIKSDGFSFQAEMICKCISKGLSHKYCWTSLEAEETRGSKAFTIKNILQAASTFKLIIGMRFSKCL